MRPFGLKICSRCTFLAAGLVLLPQWAQAHLVQTGFGSFYDGVVHLLITPGDLLLVIACGLLAGLQGDAAARKVILFLPVVWGVGILLGRLFPVAGEFTGLTMLSFGVIGGLGWLL